MSSDNDRCFQCQETGHMACYCPHIRCFDCNKYGHVAMDCPDKIPLSGTPACHRSNTTNRHDRSSSRHHSHTRHSHHDYKDRPRFSLPDPTHITMDIGVAAIMTPIGATPGHSTDLPNVVSHATEAQVHTATAVTHHTTDLHPIEIFPKMTADLDHTNPKNNITNWHKDLLQAHKQHHGKIKTEDTNRSQLTIHHLKYYSSDDQDSDSKDDLN